MTLAAKAAQGVQRLVAAAVPQLDVANVVILDERGGVVSAPLLTPKLMESLSPALEAKHAVEQYYEARIRALLDEAYSRDGIAVAVQAAVGVTPDGEALAVPLSQSQDATARAFALRVTLSPRVTLPTGWQDNARTLVGQAIGTVEGDGIVFAPPGESAAVDTLVADPPRSAPLIDASGPPAIEEPSWILEAALATTPIAVLIGLLVMLRRARKPKRLSTSERAAFAAKLRLALSPEDIRGRS
jgi:flagellar M-ring protein FliF